MARNITDPEVRDATEQPLHRYFEDKATDERFQHDAAFQRAGQRLERTHDMNSIAPADYFQLSVEERLHLQHREGELRYPKQVTDRDLYWKLMNMAGISAATRQSFQQLNLS